MLPHSSTCHHPSILLSSLCMLPTSFASKGNAPRVFLNGLVPPKHAPLSQTNAFPHTDPAGAGLVPVRVAWRGREGAGRVALCLMQRPLQLLCFSSLYLSEIFVPAEPGLGTGLSSQEGTRNLCSYRLISVSCRFTAGDKPSGVGLQVMENSDPGSDVGACSDLPAFESQALFLGFGKCHWQAWLESSQRGRVSFKSFPCRQERGYCLNTLASSPDTTVLLQKKGGLCSKDQCWTETQGLWVQFPALPQMCYMGLGKAPLGPQFPSYQMRLQGTALHVGRERGR